MGVKGKAKGSDFERYVCRRLTWWITGSEKPEIFWRSVASGAKSTREVKFNISGDIMALKEAGMWLSESCSIECKTYKSYRLADLLFPRFSPEDWWRQATEDASRTGKRPMLIFKQLRFPVLIALEDFLDYNRVMDPKSLHSLTYKIGEESQMRMFLFEEWLKAVSPEHFKQLVLA